MTRNPGEPHFSDREKGQQTTYDSFPDVTPRRISGDDSLEASSPVDSRSDEKVIANEPGKKTGAPSQTVADKSGIGENDDDFPDDQDRKDSF
ncbi:MAG TPA: hypothetical protein VFS22_07755 [Flavisolibacter sp.]|nr:hypothetical protein [Flavisolibacter sp.]